MALLRKWTEAWKCQLNPSSTRLVAIYHYCKVFLSINKHNEVETRDQQKSIMESICFSNFVSSFVQVLIKTFVKLQPSLLIIYYS